MSATPKRAIGVLSADAPEHQLFQSERFRLKLATALLRIGEAMEHARRPYVALSGGKDSLVVAALCLAVRDDVTLAWSDDELEYPESVEYMQMWRDLGGDRFVVTLGWAKHAGWFKPWADAPYWREPFPGARRIDMAQDDWMGRQGYDLTFTGLRANESRTRAEHLDRRGLIYRVKTGTGLRACPIGEWTEDDVWALIAGWHLPYNAAYDVLGRIGVHRKRQRIGPLPLVPRDYLAEGWPGLLWDLEERYGPHWR